MLLGKISLRRLSASASNDSFFTLAVFDRDGAKMSKRKKNYPDPMEIVGKYGADALRWVDYTVFLTCNLRGGF